MNYKLSPSSLNLLEDCPRCFWLYVVKKASRPSSPFPSLPSGVDRILKQHFDRHMARGKLPPELKREGIMAKLFDDPELLAVWRNNFKGIQYQDKDSGVTLRGAIDNLLQENGKLIVLDYKTRGFALKPDTHHHYQDQLDIYNFLLRKNGYKTESYAYLLFYIPEKLKANGEFIFETKLVKMRTSVKHAEKLFDKAIEVLGNGVPKASEECAYCQWKDVAP